MLMRVCRPSSVGVAVKGHQPLALVVECAALVLQCLALIMHVKHRAAELELCLLPLLGCWHASLWCFCRIARIAAA
jgi:hypothetical protein